MIQMPLQRPKKGDTGPKGDTGAQGPPGSPGGLQGDTGVAGSQGDTGAEGIAGVPGAKGDTGLGIQGDTGVPGSSGAKGDTGGAGSQGQQGDTGVPGTAAAQGDTGSPGPKGDTGARGDTGAGDKGDTGAQGTQGPAGVQGDTGAGVQGDTGAQGPAGSAGSKGDTGTKGDTGSGVQGDTGVSGLKGDTGEGIGPKGDTGTQGDTGIQGLKGDTGGGASVSYLDDILDVDTPAPTTNQVLKWNGTAWVAAAYNADFSFAVASFNDDQSSPQLVGQASTQWKATSAINWTASYSNGPPDATPHVVVSGYADSNMSGPNYTSGQNSVAYNYPSPDSTVTFTFHATKGAVTDTSRTVTVTLYNYLKYGKTTVTSGWSSAQIMALAQSAISSTFTTVPGSGSVNAGSGEYLLYAHPSRYTTLHDAGFRYFGVTCPFELSATVSVTNDASGTPLTENFKVYRSTNANLGQSTLTVSTSDQTIDPIYWGLSTVNSGYTQNDIQTLTGGSNTISNTAQRTFNLTGGTGEHYVYALPTRLNTGPIQIWVNGVDQTGGFTKETISYTNVNGYTENYDVYYSNNTGLGAASVEIK